LPRFGAVLTTAAMPCALASGYASTGHVWITVWRRHGLNPFRISSRSIESMVSGLVTGAWPPGSQGMSPGIAPPSGRIAQFIHKPCTQAPTLMTLDRPGNLGGSDCLSGPVSPMGCLCGAVAVTSPLSLGDWKLASAWPMSYLLATDRSKRSGQHQRVMPVLARVSWLS
jgi:hypothetical protein